MKSIFSILFVVFIISVISKNTTGQELNSPEKISLSINIFKLAMGMPNLEIEYHLSSTVSVFVFSEGILWGETFKKMNHPDYIFRIGGRYHYLENADHNFNSGLFTGFTYFKNDNSKNSYAGIDSGYRYRFGNDYYIYPRALLTYGFIKSNIYPGFECLLGKAFN